MSQAAYLPLTVSTRTEETADTVTLSFVVPAKHRSDFNYQAGQFLNLKIEHEGKRYFRSYSISSFGTDEKLAITVKRVEGGVVSNYLCDRAKAGFELLAQPPKGKFTATDFPARIEQHVFYAAGSGITPIYSMIKFILHHEQSTIKLFYSNRNAAHVIFNAQLEALANQYPDRFEVIHIYTRPNQSWQGKTGRIDRVFAADLFDYHTEAGKHKAFYLCGPAAMMYEVKEALSARGIAQDYIRMEQFSPGTSSLFKKERLDVPKLESTVVATAWDDTKTVHITNHDLILDKLVIAGSEAPYSCLTGSCGTCKAKLLEGKVELGEDYALTEKDRENGYILSCQARPASPRVVISFDE